MLASNPTYGKCSDRNLQKNRDSRGRFHLFCLAAVGGGRSHCIAAERFCWFAVNLAFALQGLAHFLLVSRDRPRASALLAPTNQDWRALQYASEEMKGDRELCMAAVAQDWRALQWARDEVKGDRELCTAAVAQDGRALEHVSEEIKCDRELCMAAVTQNGHACQYCSAELQKDPKISAIVAVRQNAQRLRDAPEEMKRDCMTTITLCCNGCGRPASPSYAACCRTCTAELGRHHGPSCNAHVHKWQQLTEEI